MNLDDELRDLEVEAVPGTESVEVEPRTAEALTIAHVEARKFVDAVIDKDLPLREAAKLTGRSLTSLMKDSQVRSQVEKLLDSYGAVPEVRREVVRAKTLKIALNADDKNALQALKMLGQDPEVGIYTTGGAAKNQVTAVQVNIGENTRRVLDKIKNEGEIIDSSCADCGSSGHYTGSNTCPGLDVQDKLKDPNA